MMTIVIALMRYLHPLINTTIIPTVRESKENEAIYKRVRIHEQLMNSYYQSSIS
jgi:hypothetical protein